MACEVKCVWVGLDVAKANFEAALCVEGHTYVRSFGNSREGVAQMLAWADTAVQPHMAGATLRVVMEATGSYSIQLTAWLIELRPSCAPAIVNPSYIKAFGMSLGARNKTDKMDAQVIARYGQERRPAPEAPVNPANQRLRELVRERRHLVETITAETNRQSELCHDDVFLTKLRQQRVAALKKQLLQLEKLIKQHVNAVAELKRDVDLLESIPGVGFIVAVTVLAEVGDVRRFKSGRKLAAFCGLSPRRNESGTIRKRTRLCLAGNSHLRQVLHLSARSVIGHDHTLSRVYDHLLQRGKTKKAALAACSRKQLILMHAILISNIPYAANHDPKRATHPCGKKPTRIATQHEYEGTSSSRAR